MNGFRVPRSSGSILAYMLLRGGAASLPKASDDLRSADVTLTGAFDDHSGATTRAVSATF